MGPWCEAAGSCGRGARYGGCGRVPLRGPAPTLRAGSLGGDGGHGQCRAFYRLCRQHAQECCCLQPAQVCSQQCSTAEAAGGTATPQLASYLLPCILSFCLLLTCSPGLYCLLCALVQYNSSKHGRKLKKNSISLPASYLLVCIPSASHLALSVPACMRR